MSRVFVLRSQLLLTCVLCTLGGLFLGACGESAEAENADIGRASAGGLAPARESETPDAPPSRAHRVTDQTRLGTLPEGVGVPVGSDAPDAEVEDLAGNTTSLEDIYAEHGPLLLVFYRGGWCPYCNYQIREITEDFEEFQRRGVTPVLISVDRPERGMDTRATYQIPFPVLSDPDLHAHEAFAVIQEVDDETLARYEGYGIDIEGASGRDHHKIAVPAIFLIDPQGRVLFAHADRDYQVRPSPQQLLEMIDRQAQARFPATSSGN